MSSTQPSQPGAQAPESVNPLASAPAAASDFPVSMTERAAAQIRLVQERESKHGNYLRFGVIGGGCSGLSYKLSFEDAPGEKDKTTEIFGIKVIADPKSLLFLKGTVLDFSDGLDGQGFAFQNPNAKQTCGCGSSFSA